MDKTKMISVIAAIGVALLLLLFLPAWLGLIVGIVVGIALFYLLKDKDGASAEETPKPASQSKQEIATEALLAANIALRKGRVPARVRDAYEGLIDTLLELLPQVHEQADEGELCWVIDRIATEYLPNKSLLPYLALDEATRGSEETIASVMAGIKAMSGELSEVAEMLSNRSSSEFNAKAKFLKHRFNV